MVCETNTSNNGREEIRARRSARTARLVEPNERDGKRRYFCARNARTISEEREAKSDQQLRSVRDKRESHFPLRRASPTNCGALSPARPSAIRTQIAVSDRRSHFAGRLIVVRFLTTGREAIIVRFFAASGVPVRVDRNQTLEFPSRELCAVRTFLFVCFEFRLSFHDFR